MLTTLFSRRWRVAALLVIIAIGVQVRLAFWQLERLQERRVYNARVQAQLDQPPLTLEARTPSADLRTMEYRSVVVRGEFDFTQEVALRGQSWNGKLGARLQTPLRIAGSDRAVLVDRGWIPYEETENSRWPQYAQPGVVIVRGQIRASRRRRIRCCPSTFSKRRNPIRTRCCRTRVYRRWTSATARIWAMRGSGSCSRSCSPWAIPCSYAINCARPPNVRLSLITLGRRSFLDGRFYHVPLPAKRGGHADVASSV